MQQRSSQSLVQYWDEIRAGRVAPRRCEIEPAKISAVLPFTFILDCSPQSGYRFRLAGTRICEQLGRELRGAELRDLFEPRDRPVLESLLQSVAADGGVGTIDIAGNSSAGHEASFEMVVMPVMHASRSINRLLGCLTAIETPYWLGTVEIVRLRIADLHLVPAQRTTRPLHHLPFPDGQAGTIVGDGRRRFRVYEGGRSA